MHATRETVVLGVEPEQNGPQQFRASARPDALAQSWLDAQCGVVARLNRGAVFQSVSGSELALLAHWPHGSVTTLAQLSQVAGEALAAGDFVFKVLRDQEDEEPACLVAAPLLAADDSVHLVALELAPGMRVQQQAVMQLLKWGANWYRLLRQERPAEPQAQIASVLEVLAGSIGCPGFDECAITTVTDLAARLRCQRVSLGIMSGDHIEVCAMSNNSQLDARSNLVRDIAAAMEEAVDQDAMITLPRAPGTLPYVTQAQERLMKAGDVGSVCSLPLYSGDRVVAALTMEHESDKAFDDDLSGLCQTLGSLLGPLIELKHYRDRWIGTKAWWALRETWQRLTGPRSVLLKGGLVAALAVVLFLGTATGEFRVTAPAVVEGTIKRVVTAPQDGYVATALLRAGDLVEEGGLIASLDDRELLLERLSWASRAEQLNKEHRAATVAHDRSRAAILRAQQRQVDAQLALIDGRLDRTQLRSPIRGVVVSGDLNQSLGSPVKHGEVLFEVSPLEAFKVTLEVDERDIGEISTLQTGELTLTSMPDVVLPFSVGRVVPIATAADGRNVFMVEASVDMGSNPLRPGMEGVGKISVDERRLVWIWTRSLVDWMRLTFWNWTH